MNEPSVTLTLLIPLLALFLLAGICSEWLPMNLSRHLVFDVPNVRWIECVAQVNAEMFPRSGTLRKRRASFFSTGTAGRYVLVSLASESVGSCGQGHFQRWLRLFDHVADEVVFVTSAERQWAAWCPEGGSGDVLSNLLLLSRTAWTSAGPALTTSYSTPPPDLHVAGSAGG